MGVGKARARIGVSGNVRLNASTFDRLSAGIFNFDAEDRGSMHQHLPMLVRLLRDAEANPELDDERANTILMLRGMMFQIPQVIKFMRWRRLVSLTAL